MTYSVSRNITGYVMGFCWNCGKLLFVYKRNRRI